MESNIWIDIPGFDYQINKSCTMVKSFRKGSAKYGKILQGTKDKNNYIWYMFTVGDRRIRIGLHHLSYRTFIDDNFLPSREKVIDHIDNDQLNNKPSNLQLITQYENCVKDKYGKKSSKYVGVCVVWQTGKWSAQIKHHSKKIHLGTYDTQEQAYEAYKKKAYELKKINLE